jgi:phosphoserine aminotransferase
MSHLQLAEGARRRRRARHAVLGPRAVERLESYTPDRPLPKIFRLTKGGKLIEGIFKGETINTPSMLASRTGCSRSNGRRDRRARRADRARRRQCRGARPMGRESATGSSISPQDPAIRSNTSSACSPSLRREANKDFIKAIAKLLESEGAAYDIGAYRDAPPGLRIWCGATVDTADIEALGPWLDWAWEQCQ